MATKSEIERISVVETKVDTIIESVKTIDHKIDALDKKFAAKWVQTVVAGLVAAILLGFIGVVVAFFIPTRTANNPTTSQTTTTTTPTGSTSTTQTKDGTPSATANASAQSTPDKPSDSQSSSSGGLLNDLPKVIP